MPDTRILILDELPAALDTISRAVVMDTLNRLIEGQTSIVIDRAFASVRRSDRICPVVRGGLVRAETRDNPNAIRRAYTAADRLRTR